MKWRRFFWKKIRLPKLTEEEIENLNNSLSIKELESVIRNVSRKKTPDPYGLNSDFFQIFKGEIIPILNKLIRGVGQKVMLPNSFMRPWETQHPNFTRTLKERKVTDSFLSVT